MKFQIEKSSLADAVTWVTKSLSPRPLSPILKGILIEAKKDHVTFSVLDHEVSSKETVNAEVKEEGKVLVSGVLLERIVRMLADQLVNIEQDSNQLLVKCAKAKFNLPTMQVEDFPQFPSIPEILGKIDAKKLTQAVNQVTGSASKDETLAMLTGVKFTIDGKKITLAATDRFRLAVKTLEWEPVNNDIKAEILIPAKRLSDVVKGLKFIDEKIELLFNPSGNEHVVAFNFDNRLATTRIIEQKYPPYEKLFPESHQTIITVKTSELNDAIKRVSVMSPNGSLIKLDFNEDNLKITAGGDDLGQGEEEIPQEIFGPGLEIAFNPTYISEGLASLGEKTTIALTQPNKAVLIVDGKTEHTSNGDDSFNLSDTDFVYLVMPTRLPG